mmetsp:Transcript_1215/g.1459  ORF Transcript_1215/g.1459 Transcript_1215/m.1459 type:complete len:104 (+) Transcript_1215:1-312(+)
MSFLYNCIFIFTLYNSVASVDMVSLNPDAIFQLCDLEMNSQRCWPLPMQKASERKRTNKKQECSYGPTPTTLPTIPLFTTVSRYHHGIISHDVERWRDDGGTG